jgi:predicted DNA-binding transcriptional regulator YafY
VMAYCQLRKDYRQFRTDRILDIRLTDEVFSKGHSSLNEHINNRNEHKIPKEKVRIWVSNEACAYITNSKHYYGHISEEEVDGGVEMTFMTSEIEIGFPRWFMMIGDCAKIIEPERLKEKIKELIQETLLNL